MKGIDWWSLNNKYKNENLDPKKLEKEISRLIKDEDIESKKGIYPYILDGEEKT